MEARLWLLSIKGSLQCLWRGLFNAETVALARSSIEFPLGRLELFAVLGEGAWNTFLSLSIGARH